MRLLFVCMVAVSMRAGEGAGDSLRAMAGTTFYTSESHGAILFTGVEEMAWSGAGPGTADLRCSTGNWCVPAESVRGLFVARFPLASLPLGVTRMACVLRVGGEVVGRAEAEIRRLPPKANAVAVDRETGCLVTAGLPLLPVGFYCYSPVQPTLAEEETVRGFTMMSPYQSNQEEGREDRRRYMDRCAALGMRVHYQLLSVAGGGGVYGARGTDAQESALRDEVRAFRDHPALLAWYVSDEPTGSGVKPEQLSRVREVIREEDPYHPVSVVFMRPGRAREYVDGLDVVMVDPYPIPVRPPASAGDAVSRAARDLAPDKAVWMVPQCFGGNEHWAREPTDREMRVMGYLGIIEGARGLQYFIRHGLQGFPKSPTLWAECSRMALELSQLMPYLASHEAGPSVAISPETVRVGAWRDRGRVLVIAVNTVNQPQPLELRFGGVFPSGPGHVLYEDRTVDLIPWYLSSSADGWLSRLRFWRTPPTPTPVGTMLCDTIDGFGVRLYSVDVAEDSAPTHALHPANLIVNPSFEHNHAPGVPEGCYAKVGAGRGATFFVESRLALDGRHSLRLTSPVAGEGVAIQPFKPRVRVGDAYQFSLWAKAAPGPPQNLSLRVGSATAVVDLTEEWQHFSVTCVAGTSRNSKLFLQFRLETAGTAWVDALECVRLAPVATTSGGSGRPFVLHLDEIPSGAVLRYTLDGGEPLADSPVYEAPLPVMQSLCLTGQLYSGGVASPPFSIDVRRHAANGCVPALAFPYSGTYAGQGPGSLTDGLLGDPDSLHGGWQGFVATDLDAIVDLGTAVTLREVRGRFLQNARSWVWLPSRLTVSASEDGRTYRAVGTVANSLPLDRMESFAHEFSVEGDGQLARFVRVCAVNVGVCPPWHAGAGKDCWLFADEIMVNPMEPETMATAADHGLK